MMLFDTHDEMLFFFPSLPPVWSETFLFLSTFAGLSKWGFAGSPAAHISITTDDAMSHTTQEIQSTREIIFHFSRAHHVLTYSAYHLSTFVRVFVY